MSDQKDEREAVPQQELSDVRVGSDEEAIPVAVPVEPSVETASGKRHRRVTPNLNRPRLPDEIEEKLVPIDETSALGYDAMEDAAAKFSKFAEDEGGGVVRGPFEVTESLVFEIVGRNRASGDKPKP